MDDHELDERLSRMLAATRAEADPAVWTRVRARIEARAALAGPLGWVMRPAALGASLALLVVAAGVSLAIVGSETAAIPRGSRSLVEGLLAERGAEENGGLVTAETAVDGAVIDSGAAQ